LELAALYEKHAPKVFRLAYRFVQQTEDAEEIVQDVFMSVSVSLEKFRGEADLSTWIYRITVNKSLDVLRSRSRKKRWAKFIPWSENIDIMHDSSHLEVEQDEAVKLILEYIQSLPSQQQSAIVLTKLERYSQKDAAEILGVSEKALESLIMRAKTTLRKKMESAKDL
jgi:RNA polymerase sigma-70 factor (ECF subfamily)